MNKRVLILSASPRKKGNSDVLCDKFMTGALEGGNVVEKIFLKDKKINYCLGCLACQSNGGICVQKDDMDEIMDKMIQADIIVMSTPVYFYSMNAQMKTLIDRCCAKSSKIKDKKMYFILSAGDDRKDAMESVLDGFRGFLRCLPSPEEAGVIYGIGTTNVGDIYNSNTTKEAYEIGKSI